MADAQTQTTATGPLAHAPVWLVLSGTAAAGCAQFIPAVDPYLWGLTAPQLAGIAGVSISAVGGILVWLTEHQRDGRVKALVDRLEALAKAQDRTKEELRTLVAEEERQALADTVLKRFEQAILQAPATGSAGTAAQRLIEAALPTVTKILDVSPREEWQLYIYRAQTEGGKTVLRAEWSFGSNSKAEARSWPAGTGIVGVTFAQGQDVIVADLAADRDGVLAGMGLPSLRWRSVASVPVANSDGSIWGVVTMSSSQPNLFNENTVEGVRLLASLLETELGSAGSKIGTGLADAADAAVLFGKLDEIDQQIDSQLQSILLSGAWGEDEELNGLFRRRIVNMPGHRLKRLSEMLKRGEPS